MDKIFKIIEKICKFIICVWLGSKCVLWALIIVVLNDSGASGLPLFQLLTFSLVGILPLSVLLMTIIYFKTKKYSLLVRISIPTIVFIILYLLYFNTVYQVYG